MVGLTPASLRGVLLVTTDLLVLSGTLTRLAQYAPYANVCLLTQ
jgi:hypothetical protein